MKVIVQIDIKEYGMISSVKIHNTDELHSVLRNITEKHDTKSITTFPKTRMVTVTLEDVESEEDSVTKVHLLEVEFT